MAKAYHLKEIMDLEPGDLGGQSALTPFGGERMSESTTRTAEPSAGEKFLNEAAIWKNALEMALLGENQSK